MQKPKDEEEHVNSTLHTGNRLRISIKEFSWETEDVMDQHLTHKKQNNNS